MWTALEDYLEFDTTSVFILKGKTAGLLRNMNYSQKFKLPVNRDNHVGIDNISYHPLFSLLMLKI